MITSMISRARKVTNSFLGGPKQLLWYPTPTIPPRNTDVFSVFLNNLYAAGIVAVASAGNNARYGNPSIEDLSFNTPRSNGGRDTPLIVVGNAKDDGTRVPTSQNLDSEDKGILSLYANGDQVICAASTGNNDWAVEPSGTSQATALTAGLISYFLSDSTLRNIFAAGGVANVPMAVKNYLIEQATAFKGVWSDGIPRASTGVDVSCTNPSGSGDGPAVPPFVAPPLTATQLMLNSQPVTSGTTIVLSPNQLVRHVCFA